jgi:hypothetical protein
MAFLRHHELWVLRAGVAHARRSTHEHNRQLVEAAHAGGVDSPNWEAVEEYLGAKEEADGAVFEPTLKRQVAGRMHSKSEILKHMRKSGEEKEAIHAARRANCKGRKAVDMGGSPP